jgi:glycosyltransferase involved in cell wall biosynthesis
LDSRFRANWVPSLLALAQGPQLGSQQLLECEGADLGFTPPPRRVDRLGRLRRRSQWLGAFYRAPGRILSPSPGADRSLIELGVPDARIDLAGALLQLASSPLLRRHLGSSAARAVRARSWERSMEQLAAGYRRALAGTPAVGRQSVAQVA